MVNSCRSGFDFDMRINRYLSPLLWWKSAFEDTFPLDHRRGALHKEHILIVCGMRRLLKELLSRFAMARQDVYSSACNLRFLITIPWHHRIFWAHRSPG